MERIFVGIDIAKDQVDVHVHPTDERFQLSRDDAGLAGLVARLQPLGPRLVVLEATGGYEIPVAAVLASYFVMLSLLTALGLVTGLGWPYYLGLAAAAAMTVTSITAGLLIRPKIPLLPFSIISTFIWSLETPNFFITFSIASCGVFPSSVIFMTSPQINNKKLFINLFFLPAFPFILIFFFSSGFSR